MPNPRSLVTIAMAGDLLNEFQVTQGIYLLGSFADGLTVYDQQVRAHNLAWALWRRLEAEETTPSPRSIAIVGGGIAGLTAAACLLSRSRAMEVFVFEERWDLCPLQQGSDTRWLHPHLYRWPEAGSRAPEAGLPVLNWAEGRASDVSRSILDGFGRYADEHGGGDRLRVYVGLSHLRIHAARRSLEWMGRRAMREGSHFRAADGEGGNRAFDAVILATGFGLERGAGEFRAANSYWRNDQVAQPRLSGARANYLVSGYGDGALIDLFRLTIERFRQDTILYELFEPKLEQFEEALRSVLGEDFGRSKVNASDLLKNCLSTSARPILEAAGHRLRTRIRKDTHVVLHAQGTNGVDSVVKLFGPHSSFLNRVLLFLLFECGAFTLALGDRVETERQFEVPSLNVLIRHGTETSVGVHRLFSDLNMVLTRLRDLENTKGQPAVRRWPLGAFPRLEQKA